MPLSPQEASRRAREICSLAPIVPVLVMDDASRARPLAEALISGGLPVLEVTLRTPAALEVIREMSSVPGGVVGAGTLITPDDARAAKAAGAQFGVSPGATDRLLAACEAEGLPLLPGVPVACFVLYRGRGSEGAQGAESGASLIALAWRAESALSGVKVAPSNFNVILPGYSDLQGPALPGLPASGLSPRQAAQIWCDPGAAWCRAFGAIQGGAGLVHPASAIPT